MSTAECVSVVSSLGLQQAYFSSDRDILSLFPGYLLGVVLKDDPNDRGKLLSYWDGVVKKRAESGARMWKRLLELRPIIEQAHAESF